MTQENSFIYTGTISAPDNVTVDFKDGGLMFDIDGELVPWQVARHAPEMLHEMEKLAQALEDTGHEPPQSFYDVIKKVRGM